MFLLQEPEEFVDVHKLKIVKKVVRPISQQFENESRKLWKDVTAGLKYNDIEKATQAKADLEQKQRDEAKDRKQSSAEWETKVTILKLREGEYKFMRLFAVVQKGCGRDRKSVV